MCHAANLETKEEHLKKELFLGLWEKYLTVWIAICTVKFSKKKIKQNKKALKAISCLQASLRAQWANTHLRGKSTHND
jgi:uncharacterized protein YktB (UPF0637 family)